MSSFDARFGELRSLLHAPSPSEAWRQRIVTLLEASAHDAPERHVGQIIPYMARFSALWEEPLRRLNRASQLAHWYRIAPFARFDLTLHGHEVELDDRAIEALALTPGVERIARLELAHHASSAAAFGFLLDHLLPGQLLSLSLWNAHAPLADAGCALIAAAPALSRLELLEVACDEVSDEGFARLARSPHLRAVRELALSGNPIAACEIATMTDSPLWSGLESLDLSGTQIEAAGAAALAASPLLASLRELGLGDNVLCDEGAIALANSPFLRHLDTLYLHECGIGFPGAIALARSPHLKATIREYWEGRALALWDHREHDWPKDEA